MLCNVCFHHCDLQEGKTGFCGVRTLKGGKNISLNYGRLTSLALDPVEKKPLRRFHPGSYILSCGSYGCNQHCPFCQNHSISWSARAMNYAETAEVITPAQLAGAAMYYRDQGNIGIAFTYNEPLTGYEFVRDTAKLVHEAGMYNVLVTNGTASLQVLDELLPYIDAMNIDLKSFDPDFYAGTLCGDLDTVKAFIGKAVQHCHVEITTLVIPGVNDSDEEMRQISGWIASLGNVKDGLSGTDIPLHISRFFPAFRMRDRGPTPVNRIYELKDIAEEKLKYVYTGNC